MLPALLSESATEPSPAVPSEEVKLHARPLLQRFQVGTNLVTRSQLSPMASNQAHLPQAHVGAPPFLKAHGNLSLQFPVLYSSL